MSESEHAVEEPDWDEYEYDDGRWVDDDEKVRTALEEARRSPQQGVPRLLGMLTDTDLDGWREYGTDLSRRQQILDWLLQQRGDVAAAATWVCLNAQSMYELQVIYLSADHPREQKPGEQDSHGRTKPYDWAPALRLLVSAQDLDEDLRMEAVGSLLQGEATLKDVQRIAPDLDLEAMVGGWPGVSDSTIELIQVDIAGDGSRPWSARLSALEHLREENPLLADSAAVAMIKDLPADGIRPSELALLATRVRTDLLRSIAEADDADAFWHREQAFDVTMLTLDAAARQTPHGLPGHWVHEEVREAVRERWGPNGLTDGRLDDEDLIDLNSLVHRYLAYRRDLAASLLDDMALFERSAVTWSVFPMAFGVVVAHVGDDDEWLAIRTCPNPTTEPSVKWKMSLYASGTGLVAQQSGIDALTAIGRLETADNFHVARLRQSFRAGWSALLDTLHGCP
ncbi:hypothetical protein [Actinacidiphila glaucinigra]|uniref:Uncharacterized protein n=1 Tax=Actinacidiphila glaucinigra TaxID=235986 RepID=A0A239KQN1_9ACTN|nr:hypothetical protein [Actinacidiphila glaucinigra]SNT20042.1 hypothetical protein SAMN05216252_116100 [Actinacidiphila glaucinigra]